ncbi:MAG: hypothetical protein ACYS5V_16540 [Planctomycetota bacterium]|jgi:hypothetical protein
MSEDSTPLSPEEEEAPLSLADDDLEPISLEEGDDASAGSTKIHAFGAGLGAGKAVKEFKRPLNLTGAGATRCRVFHSKFTPAALDHMVDTINDWIDENQIEIKAVNSVNGVMEGKKPEPNIIVTVWY